MADPRPDRRPARRPGGRPLAAVAPGLPQLLGGRWAAGGGALLAWVGLLSVVVVGWHRLPAALGRGDGRTALLVLALGLAAAWAWSWRDLTGGRAAAARSPGAASFASDRAAVAGLWVLGGVVMLAALAPLLTDHDPRVGGDLLTQAFLPPSAGHPLGTDQLARDVLTRILYGARISLSIGFLAAGLAVTVGTLVGAVAAFAGGWADAVIMRGVDMLMAFPRLVLLIAIVAAFDPSIPVIVLVLGLTLWPGTARLVRAEVLSLRERDFVMAARALGYSRSRILLKHLVPNALGPVIVAATLGVGNTIVLEAGLSFLGIGVQAPTPSWGSMVADGRADLLGAWWVSTFPGLAIVFTVLAFNLVGDGLRDALDPRTGS